MKLKSLLKRLLPSYIILPVIILIISNLAIYYGCRVINLCIGRSYTDVTTAIEEAIPVMPVFAYIYVIAFPFWYLTYYCFCLVSKQNCKRLLIIDLFAKIICGIIFIVMPTTNVRPTLEGYYVGGWLLEFIYGMDLPDNLFPSIHCLESWLCCRCVQELSEKHFWVDKAITILTILICVATVYTKQHALSDVFAGLLLGEIAWQLGCTLMHTPFIKEVKQYENSYNYRLLFTRS